MALVPLPAARVFLPDLSDDPPSHKNTKDARFYLRRAKVAFRSADTYPDVFANAITYEAKIIATKIAAADAVDPNTPPILDPALTKLRTERLDEIEEVKTGIAMVAIEDLRDELEEFRNDTERKLEKLGERITSTERLGAITFNMNACDGVTLPFHRVPFRDGDDPVAVHHPPALRMKREHSGTI